jgi:hypothetical protein
LTAHEVALLANSSSAIFESIPFNPPRATAVRFLAVATGSGTLIEHHSMVEAASIDCRRRTLATIEATNYAEDVARGRAVVARLISSAICDDCIEAELDGRFRPDNFQST